MTKRKAYCFNCNHEIDVKLGSESCPLCGSDDWNFSLKRTEVTE